MVAAVSGTDYLAGIGAQSVDELAIKMAAAMVAVYDVARPSDDAGDATRRCFEIASVRTFITLLAAWVVSYEETASDVPARLEQVIAKLRWAVADHQASSR